LAKKKEKKEDDFIVEKNRLHKISLVFDESIEQPIK